MRQTIEFIQKKRGTRCATVLLTGATGFLGSHIAARLIREGCRLILLARGNKAASPGDRLDRIFRWLGLNEDDLGNVTILEAAIEDRNLGLDDRNYRTLVERTDEIIHAAAATSFSDRHREEAERTNVASLANVLSLAARSSCYFFHHLSTAYVAGKRAGVCPEEIVETEEFHNVYERTKFLGEKLARDECARAGIRLNIYRPSIVYGDSRTGRCNRFNALYYPVKTFLFLKDIYERALRTGDGARAREIGVGRESDGTLRLPLRLEERDPGAINLVPIDHFTEAFLHLMNDGLSGGIFHLTSDKPSRLGDLVEYTGRMFGIRGLAMVGREDFSRSPRNPLETLYESFLAPYRPYMLDARSFDRTRSDGILSKHRISCPVLSYQVFQRCIDYAVTVDWGKKLYKDED